MAISPEQYGILCAALGGLVVALVNGFCTLWAARLARESEDRRQTRDLAMKVAMDNWKMGVEAFRASQGAGIADINWINVYLVHAAHMVAALDGSMKTKEDVEKHLNEGFAKMDIARESFNVYWRQKITPKGRGAN
jgi:hypothetical protein